MPKDKRSFFERLTGTVSLEDNEFDANSPKEQLDKAEATMSQHQEGAQAEEFEAEENAGEGQLTVDVYQTEETIVIKTLVAGVKPDDLDVSITRDMVTIRGKRDEEEVVTDENYFYRELYWGAFSRTILLPQEIEVEDAEAVEKQGLLIITLPKIDKEKQTKLKVRAN